MGSSIGSRWKNRLTKNVSPSERIQWNVSIH